MREFASGSSSVWLAANRTSIGALPIGLARARRRVGRFVAGTRSWLVICGDALAAAEMYQELSRLSDAELERRRLSRQQLTRFVVDKLTQHT